MKFTVAALIAALLSLPALADEKHHVDPMADGEVRKVDKDAKKITIKHGPLQKLEMPAMTMVFQVRDPALLEKVKAGDKVRFEAEKVGGGYAVTRIEQAK
jgi:Cu(I)/Ag(I) efflux system periplasmic protein CusF